MKLEHWQMKDFAAGEGDAGGGEGWIPVQAPGDTYLALHAAGRIPHPFVDDHEKACNWVEGREWWWRTTFEAEPAGDAERVLLVFEGLDTFATLWMNGELLGSSDNMFRPVSFDISARLAGGTNTLAIRFTPTAAVTADRPALTFPGGAGAHLSDSKRNLIRKAQFVWGWDWGPSFPTVGVWKPVRIERQRHAALRDVRFATLSRQGRVRVDVDVDAFAPDGALLAHIAIADPGGKVVAERHLDPAETGSAEFDIADPQLWWTRELGGQPLYDLTVTLAQGGEAVDRRTLKVGLRTIELDRSADPDEPGTEFFRFVLNGVPIFAKGANWIPASSFFATVPDADYERLLTAAADANMNMIRIWGGGIYEPDVFHDLCDRLGLLVWQDFMFACAPYPEGDAAFVESVRGEVACQIRRLRNHPSTALWCGNNEGQVIQQLVNHATGGAAPFEGERLFDTVIAEVAAELDPTTPYWPGSPYGGPLGNSMLAGDVHDWTVWHGIPPIPEGGILGAVDRSPEGVAYTRYAEDMGRFISEFGIQASPALSTLTRWMEREPMTLNGEAFLNRIKDNPKNKVDGMLVSVTGLPQTLDQYVDFTQLVQGEGLKFGIEHFRRRTPHCSGALFWQYNDCWPGMSWSVVDYDGVCKAGYDYVRRAFAPVLASFKALGDGGVELWITNDTLGPLPIVGRVALTSVTTGEIWHETLEAAVGAGESRPVWRASADRAGALTDHVLTVRGKGFAANRHFFAPIKDIPFPTGLPRLQVEKLDSGRWRATLTGTAYHYGVSLSSPDPAARFSDNHFDLMPEETQTVIVHGATPTSGDLAVRTLGQALRG